MSTLSPRCFAAFAPVDRKTKSLIYFTPTAGVITEIWQTAFLPLPSAALAVIFAVPSVIPFTSPSPETVAILLLLLFQMTSLFVAFEGLTVALRLMESPFSTETVVLFSVIFDTLAVFLQLHRVNFRGTEGRNHGAAGEKRIPGARNKGYGRIPENNEIECVFQRLREDEDHCAI